MDRKKVFVQIAVALVVAIMFYILRKPLMAAIICVMAVCILMLSYIHKPSYQSLDRFFQALGHGVGIVMTWLLLVPFFYLVCTMMRLAYIISGKDPMNLGYDKNAATYWKPVLQHVRDEAYYKRQF